MTTARFNPGNEVQVRGSDRVGVVLREFFRGDERWYGVSFGNPAKEEHPERNLVAPGTTGITVEGKLGRHEFLSADAFRHALTVVKLCEPLEQILYSYRASRTDLQPYQFKPVLKLLSSPYGRLFIADEVGLGKTIEAGIVMLELAARGPMRRVLVCCPPALTRKWRLELLERFDSEFEILTSDRAKWLFSDPEGIAAPCRVIGSLHSLRRQSLVADLAESDCRFDLVIVDESHHMQNPDSRSHDLGEQLSAAADHMLMLSATPLSLSTDNLFHQLRILAPDEFFDSAEFRLSIAPNQHINGALRALRGSNADPVAALAELRRIEQLPVAGRFLGNPFYTEACAALSRADRGDPIEQRVVLQKLVNDLNTLGHVFTRTRKREIAEHFPTRRSHVVRVELTELEFEFYEAVTEFVRAQPGGIPSFATIMPQRQVASSIPAAREYLLERFGAEITEVEEDTRAEIELGEDDDIEVESLARLRPSERLLDALRACEGLDSKYEEFEKAMLVLIDNGAAKDGKILVFSFFRKTIEGLARRLRAVEVDGQRLRVSILYGPTPPEERHEIVRAFRSEPGPHIVLASEVAAEGLDFEFANVIVNYDLPWNPMKVEQRIGRLDRYGQQSDLITIVNFSVRDTIEQRILDRLYERIGIFEKAIGDLESILGDEIEKLTKELLRPDLTPAEEGRRIDQVAENIRRRKIEAERFDEESKGLLGQDEIFGEQFDRMTARGGVIDSTELANFVSVALRRVSPRLRVAEEPEGRARIRVPENDHALTDSLHRYTDQHPERVSARAIRASMNARPGSEWLFTFDSDVAKRERQLDFVTMHHPLVCALLAGEPKAALPTAAFLVDDSIPAGAFFIYLLAVTSFKSSLELMPVVVGANGAVDSEVSARLLATLTEARDACGSEALPSEGQIGAAFSAAEAWIGRKASEREVELSRISDQVIDRRIDSLRSSHERWKTNREGRLADAEAAGNVRMARLHRGWLRNRTTQLDEQIARLESQRTVTVSTKLLAGGVLVHV